MEFEVVPLHKHSEHFDECANILNAEWPRSKAAREYSLSKSCDGMPCSLVFRRKETHEVFGYSRIVAVQGKYKACLFESVIIRNDMRGVGLGKKLMTATEEYAKSLGFLRAFLNTIDKEGFYSYLGYDKCGPVTSLGANAHRLPDNMLLKILGAREGEPEEQSKTSTNTVSSVSQLQPQLQQPPPPPPVSSTSAATPQSRHVIRMNPNSVIWMQKFIAHRQELPK